MVICSALFPANLTYFWGQCGQKMVSPASLTQSSGYLIPYRVFRIWA